MNESRRKTLPYFFILRGSPFVKDEETNFDFQIEISLTDY